MDGLLRAGATFIQELSLGALLVLAGAGLMLKPFVLLVGAVASGLFSFLVFLAVLGFLLLGIVIYGAIDLAATGWRRWVNGRFEAVFRDWM
ncbi:hypothetical protein QZJ86_12155 [Methylomonas montana]|uniref:hypothetical protein n=1 Tax=Methylomonas montana TaxID=3058963 RepID=UPI00265A111D|nr:hypothetical protein [Methylomonas montana]WKJ88775.1 hypothetical protein QZJ86_12155 [Methylomonas montana]